MNWWNRFWRRQQIDEQLEKELAFHLEEHTSELVAQGYEPDEARRRARLDLGGPEQVKEQCRDARGTRWLEDLLCATHAPQESRFCGGRIAHARAWHRRHHGYVHGRRRRAAQAAVLS